MDNSKILDRIQKLLAMSKDSSSPHEAAIAARRAEAMMREHNLSQADVIIKEIVDNDIIASPAETGRKTVPDWIGILAVPVAKMMDCTGIIYTNERTKKKTINFIGYTGDVQVASWILNYLVEQIDQLSKKYRYQIRATYGPRSGAADMDNYRMGMVHSIMRSIREIIQEKENQLKSHVPGTSLVILKKDMIEKKFGVHEYVKAEVNFEADKAYRDGVLDGKKVRIQPVIGQDQRQSLR